MNTNEVIAPLELQSQLGVVPPPAILDVRRAAAFERDPRLIPRAVRRAPEALDQWAPTLEPWRPVIVYCVHGHEVSQDAAAALRRAEFDARSLEGGFEVWRAPGENVVDATAPTRWVTRARPKIDRIACPWLIRRFIAPA